MYSSSIHEVYVCCVWIIHDKFVDSKKKKVISKGVTFKDFSKYVYILVFMGHMICESYMMDGTYIRMFKTNCNQIKKFGTRGNFIAPF